jgi:alkylated DNA repair dioxygenase AlkB
MMAKREEKQQEDLFGAKSALLEGFAYREDATPEIQASRLVAMFEVLPFKPFEFHGYLGNRRTVSFGWSYDYSGRALRKGDALPDWLLPLRSIAAGFAGVAAASLEQSTVIEYAPGAGIGWHRDKPEFQDVLAFSFLAPCTLRVRRKRDDAKWDRASITAQPGSLYLLRGDARIGWYHSIPPVKALRYSVTFRNLRANMNSSLKT